MEEEYVLGFPLSILESPNSNGAVLKANPAVLTYQILKSMRAMLSGDSCMCIVSFDGIIDRKSVV